MIDRVGNTNAQSGEFRGDVSPRQAWHALQSEPDAVLVDVRTYAEWAYVGGPDLSPLRKPVVRVEWLLFPTMLENTHFVPELQAQGIRPTQPVYLICRSGARSRQAAEVLAAQGYTTYNVADGFEGHLDANGHRGLGGWRADGLPWQQS
jgi:rhodanese-related sulfurtransferase